MIWGARPAEAPADCVSFTIIGTLLGRLGIKAEVVCRIRQRDMREGLRKVSDEALGLWIVLLRKQAHIVAKGQQAFEQIERLAAPALQHVVVNQPEAAPQEGS